METVVGSREFGIVSSYMMCQNMEVAMSGNKEGKDVATEGKLDKLLVWRDLKCIIR